MKHIAAAAGIALLLAGSIVLGVVPATTQAASTAAPVLRWRAIPTSPAQSQTQRLPPMAHGPMLKAQSTRPVGQGPSSANFTWKIPAKGHIGSWSAQKGVLRYGGGSNATLLAPFAISHGANFAVQAQIRSIGPGGIQGTLNGFGLLVRQNPSDPHTSISGGSFFSSSPEDNNPLIAWNGQTVGGGAFTPGTAWHTYRLQAQGDQYTLLIDGKQMVAYTIGDYPNPTRAGIFSTFFQIQVRNFQVLSLGPAATRVPTDPVAKTANLTIADMPTDGFYEEYLSHWYPNDELARERSVSVASLVAEGRITSYGADFYVLSHTALDIYNTVASFTTASGAQKDAAARLTQIRANLPAHTSYQDLHIPVGDTSDGFVLDFDTSVGPARVLRLIATRGRYQLSLTMLTIPGEATLDQNIALFTQLAQTVDQRIVSNE